MSVLICHRPIQPMLSRLFLDDPVAFARHRALLPQLGLEEPQRLKPKIVDPLLTVYQVRGRNRVLFANIVADPEAQNRYEVQFNAAQLTADWFPVYWLPWQFNHTYRITLRRSKKVLNTANPHVFFTAALSGCMVHVDGDPYEPTVYHSNARDLPYSPPPNRETEIPHSMREKKGHMHANVVRAHAAFPKGPSHYNPQWLDAFTYSQIAASAELRAAFERSEQERLGAEMIISTYPMGMVFGIKSPSHGIWTFYYQALVQVRYQKNAQRFETWTVSACERLWPGADIQKPIKIQIIGDDEEVEDS